MDIILRVFILVLGFLCVFSIFYLLITRKINERSSLPWILGAFVIMVITVAPGILETLAAITGIAYPPALLFLVSNIVMFLLILYQAVQISALQAKCKELSQNLAIINSTGIKVVSNLQKQD